MNLENSIAIIIVTYNGAEWIDKCIYPLYDINNIKIIVIDNNSADSTVKDIENKYPKVELIISDVNLGFGQANNKGFEYAINNNFDFVFLLNQDASIDSQNIEKLVFQYKKDKTVGILSPVHYKNETEIENLFDFYLNDSNVDKSKVGNDSTEKVKFVNAALWLISVDNLKLIGGFNPLYFHYGEDVDYVNRLIYKKLNISIVLNVKGFHYRNYSKEVFKEKFEKNRYFGPWNIKYYTILSNINNSFTKTFVSSFNLFIRSFIKYFIKGYFNSSIMSLKIYFEILKKLTYIKKNREIQKNKSLPFINTN